MKALLAGFAILLAVPGSRGRRPGQRPCPSPIPAHGRDRKRGRLDLRQGSARRCSPNMPASAAPIAASSPPRAGSRVDRLVKAGNLRFSWRPFLIFPQDRAAAVLTRCVAPSRRLAFIEAVMARPDRDQGRAHRRRCGRSDPQPPLRGRACRARQPRRRDRQGRGPAAAGAEAWPRHHAGRNLPRQRGQSCVGHQRRHDGPLEWRHRNPDIHVERRTNSGRYARRATRAAAPTRTICPIVAALAGHR